MTVDGILKNENFSPIVLVDGDREIRGAYCGDLLSWVMGRAEEDNAFITIMTNVNVIAVAQLVNVSVVIVCENAELSDEFIQVAKSKEVNVLKCALPSFETCALLSGMI
ncbi:MAG: hypothetical protein IIU65_01165 [Clostridia bacterium]|nr:hypothetical protein [Clostridia bacterium]